MNSYGKRGSGPCDQWMPRDQEMDNSAMSKMQHQFWVTKQTVFKKLGKKEDECIVASDAELDAKLELFRSVQLSCCELQRIIEKYQERLCLLSQEENAMGRFLKEAGKNDKTRAGKMMTTVGKSLSYCGQQRLSLRMPLVRLYQEVETFRHRAIEDTLQNVHAMEKSRTEYRATLNWMKEVSQQLDPDTFKQLEKFRKVQTQVRRSKVRFDQQKLDCLQKVDLLAAARCNMFSHALILYQSTLLTFTENATKTFANIANSFKGYQHYEFSVVKELAESSMKLAEETGQPATEETGQEKAEDKDQMFFFESEYHDEKRTEENKTSEDKASKATAEQPLADGEMQEVLLDLGPSQSQLLTSSDLNSPKAQAESMDLLNELFSAPPAANGSVFGDDWQELLGGAKRKEADLLPGLMDGLEVSGQEQGQISDSFLPSRLLDSWSTQDGTTDASPLLGESLNLGISQPTANKMEASSSSSNNNSPAPSSKKVSAGDMTAWFNLFADLDPLANPDAIGRQAGLQSDEEQQRNC